MHLEDEIWSSRERQMWVENHSWVHRAEGLAPGGQGVEMWQ